MRIPFRAGSIRASIPIRFAVTPVPQVKAAMVRRAIDGRTRLVIARILLPGRHTALLTTTTRWASYGGPRYDVAEEQGLWVYLTDHAIKPFLAQCVQTMCAKLSTTANGNHSAKYTQIFKDVDVIEKLVKRLKRQSGEQLPPVIDGEPAPMPPHAEELPAAPAMN